MTSRRRKREHIPLSELLASALADRLTQDERDILREKGKEGRCSAADIISLFTPDHNRLHALGGPDKWWNLTMARRGPALKAKDNRDTSIVAKVRRLEPQHEEFRRKVLARPPGRKRERTGNWPQGRKLQSKSFERRQ